MAYHHLHKCLSTLRPNRAFVEQLSKWEEKLFGATSTVIEDPNFWTTALPSTNSSGHQLLQRQTILHNSTNLKWKIKEANFFFCVHMYKKSKQKMKSAEDTKLTWVVVQECEGKLTDDAEHCDSNWWNYRSFHFTWPIRCLEIRKTIRLMLYHQGEKRTQELSWKDVNVWVKITQQNPHTLCSETLSKLLVSK